MHGIAEEGYSALPEQGLAVGILFQRAGHDGGAAAREHLFGDFPRGLAAQLRVADEHHAPRLSVAGRNRRVDGNRPVSEAVGALLGEVF